MGLKFHLRRLKSCCKSDNYFDEPSYSKKKDASTDSFLRRRTDSNESSLSNINLNSRLSSDFDENGIKPLEIDESSILSDKNINQLRKRNPRLNRFDNDIIRLSLRKSLYSNNLEQDLENFLREQQRDPNAYDYSYTISDMKELYQLINSMSIKDLEKFNLNYINTEEKIPLPIEENIKTEDNNYQQSESLKENGDITKTNISCNDKKNELICLKPVDSNLLNNDDTKITLNEDVQIDKVKNTKKIESLSSLPKDTNIKEQKDLIHCSSEQNKKEEIETSSQDTKIQNSDNEKKLLDIDISEILLNLSNKDTADKSNSLQQNTTELINPSSLLPSFSFDHNEKEFNNKLLLSSPDDLLLNENKNDNKPSMICTSPQKSYNDILCASPEDKFAPLNSNSHSILCESPEDEFAPSNIKPHSILCESPEDEFAPSNTKPHSILCESPEQSNILCESPNKRKPYSILCASPTQDYTDMICESPKDEFTDNDGTHSILCASPIQDYADNLIYDSPVDESFDDTRPSSVLCASPSQKKYVHNSLDNDLYNSETGMLITSAEQRFSEKILTHSSNKDFSKPKRKSTGLAHSFNSFEFLTHNKNKDNVSKTHDKDLLLSHLKMTELSTKKEDNSFNKSDGSDISKFLNYTSRPSQTSESSFQSYYSYENMDSMSSRKITKRGLKILKSKDTLTSQRQKPINLKDRRRKALLIGINYKGKPYQLQGCVNDAKYLMKFLKENYDFKEENFRIMTDDAEDEKLIPTRENIINSMKWLTAGAKAGDSLLFHYSGHGLSVEDKDGDEIDGLDESILPLDYEENGVILDDEIHDIMVKPLPEGCLLTALADCCHSGTVLDLPFSYNISGSIESIEEIDKYNKELSKEYLSNESYQKNKKLQQLISRNSSPPQINLSLSERKRIDIVIKKIKRTDATVVQFSSCRDNEISADERANGNTYGALCNAFISTLTSVILEEKLISYIDLLINIRTIVRKRYGQTPQLTTGRPMDVTKPFEL